MAKEIPVRVYLSLLLLALCAGCALTSEKLYEGPERSRAELGSLSSVGLYPMDSVALTVIKINGKDVVGGRTAEFLMSPGAYTVTVNLRKDFRPGFGLG